MTTPLDSAADGSCRLLAPSPSTDAAPPDEPIGAVSSPSVAALFGGGSQKKKNKAEEAEKRSAGGRDRRQKQRGCGPEEEQQGECERTKSSRLISAASDPPAAQFQFTALCPLSSDAFACCLCHSYDQLTPLHPQLIDGSESSQPHTAAAD